MSLGGVVMKQRFDIGEVAKKRVEYYAEKVKPKLNLVEGYARAGYSNKQIAANLGIGETTMDRYTKKHPELLEAITYGRQDAEIMVENALFKRAIGYKYKEVWKERVRDVATGEFVFHITKAIQKEMASDVNAAIYWLEHRAPRRWEKERWRRDMETAKLAILEKKLSLLAKDYGYDGDDSDDGFIDALKAAAKDAWRDEVVDEEREETEES